VDGDGTGTASLLNIIIDYSTKDEESKKSKEVE
jgi:hypothetical protein